MWPFSRFALMDRSCSPVASRIRVPRVHSAGFRQDCGVHALLPAVCTAVLRGLVCGHREVPSAENSPTEMFYTAPSLSTANIPYYEFWSNLDVYPFQAYFRSTPKFSNSCDAMQTLYECVAERFEEVVKKIQLYRQFRSPWTCGSEALVCSPLIVGIVGSNPAEGIDVHMLCLLPVV
jgi:hypothetical protein